MLELASLLREGADAFVDPLVAVYLVATAGLAAVAAGRRGQAAGVAIRALLDESVST